MPRTSQGGPRARLDRQDEEKLNDAAKVHLIPHPRPSGSARLETKEGWFPPWSASPSWPWLLIAQVESDAAVCRGRRGVSGTSGNCPRVGGETHTACFTEAHRDDTRNNYNESLTIMPLNDEQASIGQ